MADNPSGAAADAASTEKLLAAAVSGFGGSDRPGQRRMANAVDKALGSGRHLAVQAGTGTGKSLAYLVPAFRHAQQTNTCVIVSTATLALQRQLIERDLPRLADSLEPVMSRRPTFAIMKGRSNYLCMNKIAQAQLEPELVADAEQAEQEADAATPSTSGTSAGRGNPEPITWLGKQIASLHDWAQETDTGDPIGSAPWRERELASE